MKHTVPAGLLNHHYEFFVDESTLNAYCLTHGRVIPFEEFPEDLLYVIDLQITLAKRRAAQALGATDRLQVIKLFLICNYGGFDHQADMINGILQPAEFWACPQRGTCPQEGILCDPLTADNGSNLSPREVQIIRLIARGKLNKEIANELFIEESTVASHTRNIRQKTALLRKVDITRFAAKNQLI